MIQIASRCNFSTFEWKKNALYKVDGFDDVAFYKCKSCKWKL